MEKKMKRIPFDLELAKAITKGEKEGRVVNGKGDVVDVSMPWNAIGQSVDGRR